MSQLESVIDSLNDLGYSNETGSLIDNPEALRIALESNTVEYSKIVSYLTEKLRNCLDLEEKVNSIENDSDKATFYLEISSFLKELSCPYRLLTVGIIDERFNSFKNRLDLIDFLSSELQAAKITSINKPQTTTPIIRQKSSESEEAKALKKILITLGFPKPPANVSVNEIWSRIENKCKQLLSELPKGYLGSPLLNALLSSEQWEQLMKINQMICDDFQLRRELLLTRLDVTIQSFKWADRLKKNNNEIANLYHQRRKDLSVRQNVKVYDILAARDDLLKQEKTCSTRLMCKSHLHKIIIPKVPDRGGRTGELEPPPPEMPKFMQRRATNPQPQNQRSAGGGRVGRGGHKYDNSSNWNPPQSDFERFQNQDYHGGSGQGSYRGGGGRGGRGGRRY